jgi:hypothetical protein
MFDFGTLEGAFTENHCGTPGVYPNKGHGLIAGLGNVVILIAFKGRIEIDEVNGFVFDVVPENVEIVAVVEFVHRADCNSTRATQQVQCPKSEARQTGTPTEDNAHEPLVTLGQSVQCANRRAVS